MADYKNMTTKEIDTFLKNNQHGILALGGDKPYALPMGYLYRRRAILLGLATAGSMVTTGRKMNYVAKSKQVCFTVCQPRWYGETLKTPCTTLVIEGSLEEVTNRSYYGIKKVPQTVQLKLYKIKVAKMGARKCNRKPCELLAAKK
jgi:nitroimidazol reductase NimA-like FMN-containing flavoprotein (pyridoxamine 5'-phosphate oxidase superfamily)